MLDNTDKKPKALPAVPVPSTMQEWQDMLRLKQKLIPLNDRVEAIVLDLIEDDRFLSFLHALYDEQAVEGSCAADNLFASIMIREKALESSSLVGKEKAATISKALGVVLRRYGLSRKDRKNTVDGQLVPESTSNNE